MSRLNGLITAMGQSALPPIEVYTGLVTGAILGGWTNGEHGPASGVQFKVLVNFPTGPAEITIKPVSEQWPDTIDVVPPTINTVVLVANVNNELQLTAQLLPWVEPCGQSRGSIRDMESVRLIGSIKNLTPAQKAIVRQDLGL